jgi:hypothetical protein
MNTDANPNSAGNTESGYKPNDLDTNALPPLPRLMGSLDDENLPLGYTYEYNNNHEVEDLGDEDGENSELGSAPNLSPAGTEENQEGENDEDIQMDPNHPLLQRVQAAIYDQLSRHKNELELQLRERVCQMLNPAN